MTGPWSYGNLEPAIFRSLPAASFSSTTKIPSASVKSLHLWVTVALCGALTSKMTCSRVGATTTVSNYGASSARMCKPPSEAIPTGWAECSSQETAWSAAAGMVPSPLIHLFLCVYDNTEMMHTYLYAFMHTYVYTCGKAIVVYWGTFVSSALCGRVNLIRLPWFLELCFNSI